MEKATVPLIQRPLLFGLAALALLASGCQTASSTTPIGGLDNTGFMSLWQTYSHCRLSSDLSEAQRDMIALTEATRIQYGNDGFILPLPPRLNQLVHAPTNRFAVDVRAMASACSLHAGHLALEQGRVDLARELFATVVKLHPREESSYYLTQAQSILSGLDHRIEVSLTLR